MTFSSVSFDVFCSPSLSSSSAGWFIKPFDACGGLNKNYPQAHKFEGLVTKVD